MPYFVIETFGAESGDEDVVGFLEDAYLLWCDVAKDSDAETRTWERVATEEVWRNVEGCSDAAHFIFEEEAERLDELEVHLFGKTADVVVALDFARRAIDGGGLDDVGVDGALAEPTRIFYFHCLGVEDLDEVGADDFTFLLRLCDTCEVGHEAVGRIDTDDVEIHVLILCKDALIFIFTEQTVVDEYASEVFANGFVEEHSGDGGVYATRETEDYAVLPDELADVGDGALDE